MLSFFPNPYPDETVYSIIARYHKRIGNLKFSKTIEELFGVYEFYPSSYSASLLTELINALPKKSGYDEEYFIRNHTIYPYYESFLTEKQKQESIEGMKSSTYGCRYREDHMMYGYNTLFKICPSCIMEDKENYGEAYFHRVHQISGYVVCHKHGDFLQEYSIELNYRDFTKNDIVDIDDINLRSINNAEEIKHKNKLIRISKDIYQILHNFKNLDKKIVYDKYYYMLKKKELVDEKGVPNINKIKASISEMYSNEFISTLNLKKEYNWDRYNWVNLLTQINAINSGYLPIKNPLFHLLIIKYLFGSLEEFIVSEKIEYPIFEQGPWPCLNRTAIHYHKDVVKNIEIVYEQRKIGADIFKGNPIGIFTCECGFSYSRRGPYKDNDYTRYQYESIKIYGKTWEKCLEHIILDGKLPVREIGLILNCDDETILHHAEKLGIKEHINRDYDNLKYHQIRRIWKEKDKEIQEKVLIAVRKLVSEDPLIKLDRYSIKEAVDDCYLNVALYELSSTSSLIEEIVFYCNSPDKYRRYLNRLLDI